MSWRTTESMMPSSSKERRRCGAFTRGPLELCEDVALHAAAFLAGRHQEGDNTGEALKRCHEGLRADPEAFAVAEAAWVVRRVAELQDWPQPAWLPDGDAGTDIGIDTDIGSGRAGRA